MSALRTRRYSALSSVLCKEFWYFTCRFFWYAIASAASLERVPMENDYSQSSRWQSLWESLSYVRRHGALVCFCALAAFPGDSDNLSSSFLSAAAKVNGVDRADDGRIPRGATDHALLSYLGLS